MKLAKDIRDYLNVVKAQINYAESKHRQAKENVCETRRELDSWYVLLHHLEGAESDLRLRYESNHAEPPAPRGVPAANGEFDTGEIAF